MAIWKIHSDVRDAADSVLTHFKSYAAALATDTNDVFKGNTDWVLDEETASAVYRLSVVIPSLNHYTHQLFKASTENLDADYPLILEYTPSKTKKQHFRCLNSAEFKERMEQLIGSDETAQMLGAYKVHLDLRAQPNS